MIYCCKILWQRNILDLFPQNLKSQFTCNCSSAHSPISWRDIESSIIYHLRYWTGLQRGGRVCLCVGGMVGYPPSVSTLLTLYEKRLHVRRVVWTKMKMNNWIKTIHNLSMRIPTTWKMLQIFVNAFDSFVAKVKKISFG